jgi:hypothetical protein
VLTSGSLVLSPQTASLAGVAARVSLLSFLPLLAVLAVLVWAGSIVWRLPDPSGDLLVRAVVLSTLLACAGQLRYALESAGFDLMDPAAQTFILLSYYLAPAVCAAGIFFVLLGVASYGVPSEPGRLELHPRALSIATAAVLALAAAHAGNTVGRPKALPAIASGILITATERTPASIDPVVIEAAAPDDTYIVGRSGGDAITMMSVLKMKARAAAALLNPANVRIVVAKRPS